MEIEEKTPELTLLRNRLDSYSKYNRELIECIGEKVNKIKRISSPTNVSNPPQEPDGSELNLLKLSIDVIDENNYVLEYIRNTLNEII